MKTIFPNNFYYHFKAPNSEEFISFLDQIECKKDPQDWSKLCLLDTTKIEIYDVIPHLSPSIKIFFNYIKYKGKYNLQRPWINFYQKGYFQEIHDHLPGSDFSCVFFVNDGKDFSNFYFWNKNYNDAPSNVNRIMTIGRCNTVDVKSGDILFFPSHLLHGVTPHKSNTIRKTFSCNFSLIFDDNINT